ncbi:uncharacterized protein CLUP02_13206 [Colletotrichum lupini]|uniref:Uncharacterized protein n=1 Tax=Colletotrichum lupini TaxID=145971 RepID=A0A9Q8T1Z1_9PEZI|nr:uncharacterized protein CLUP02_13206 [Colletotrichum lupini]UQC87687.1 hypothetical protein CLUP02_13206 [Colletotrichum lupini]
MNPIELSKALNFEDNGSMVLPMLGCPCWMFVQTLSYFSLKFSQLSVIPTWTNVASETRQIHTQDFVCQCRGTHPMLWYTMLDSLTCPKYMRPMNVGTRFFMLPSCSLSRTFSSGFCKLDDPLTLCFHAQCRYHSLQLLLLTVRGCLIDAPQRAKSLVIPSTSTSCSPTYSFEPNEFHHPQHPRHPFRSAGLMLLVIRVTARSPHPFCIRRPKIDRPLSFYAHPKQLIDAATSTTAVFLNRADVLTGNVAPEVFLLEPQLPAARLRLNRLLTCRRCNGPPAAR